MEKALYDFMVRANDTFVANVRFWCTKDGIVVFKHHMSYLIRAVDKSTFTQYERAYVYQLVEPKIGPKEEKVLFEVKDINKFAEKIERFMTDET